MPLLHLLHITLGLVQLHCFLLYNLHFLQMLLMDCIQALLQLGCQKKRQKIFIDRKSIWRDKEEQSGKKLFYYLHALDSVPFLSAGGRCSNSVPVQHSLTDTFDSPVFHSFSTVYFLPQMLPWPAQD